MALLDEILAWTETSLTPWEGLHNPGLHARVMR